jgi:sugar phosphate isomerase/epimerase
VEAVGHPLVGICLDTGHAHMSGLDVAAAVRRLAPHLRATHIADNHGNADEHFAPFNGTVDWAATMKALGEVGYRNDFSFEIHMLTAPYPAAVQKNLIRFTHDLGGYLLSLARGG